MPKQLQCAQGHQWETGIGRQGQVPVLIPVCPMCGASPVRKWSDWRDLSWTTRAVFITILGLIPVVVFGMVFYFHQHQRLLRATLQGHEDAVMVVTFSPDGRLLASGSGDKLIKVWDVENGSAAATVRTNGPIIALGFSPIEPVLVSANNNNWLDFWDLTTNRPKNSIALPIPVVALAFAPNGQSWALGLESKELAVLSSSRWSNALPSRVPLKSGITCLAFSPDSELLAAGTRSGTVVLWDVPKNRLFASLDGPTGPVTSLTFASDRRTLAVGTEDGNLVLWDSLTGRRHHTWKGNKGSVKALSFSPTKMLLASAGGGGPVKLWEVVDDHLKERSACRDFQGEITSLAFSPDGKILALGSTAKTVVLWNVSGLLQLGPEE